MTEFCTYLVFCILTRRDCWLVVRSVAVLGCLCWV